MAVVALGFVFALALGAAGIGQNTKVFGAGTTLTIISGDVTVRHGASAFTVASDGDVLNAGDAIRTGVEGRAVLTYFEGSTVTIEPFSELAIDAANSTVDGSTVVSMTQTLGRTWHVVTKLITGGSKYEVRTPASTASVRGTAFSVDADATNTTITTTEGTVLDRVPDPSNPGQTIDVPVRAGEQHSQQRGQGAGPSHGAPAPERKVTITLSDENSIVIDTLGRANGIDKDGKSVRQTPGATLEKVDGHLVITLPNVPDGLLRVLAPKPDGDVDVQTVVDEHGSRTTSTGKASADGASGQKRADVQIGGVTPKPTASASPTPEPTRAAGGGSGGGAGATAAPSAGQGGQGQSGAPSRSPGFVPAASLPNIPPTVSPPVPTKVVLPSGVPTASGRP